jgi:hypothetical protein
MSEIGVAVIAIKAGHCDGCGKTAIITHTPEVTKKKKEANAGLLLWQLRVLARLLCSCCPCVSTRRTKSLKHHKNLLFIGVIMHQTGRSVPINRIDFSTKFFKGSKGGEALLFFLISVDLSVPASAAQGSIA